MHLTFSTIVFIRNVLILENDFFATADVIEIVAIIHISLYDSEG